MLYYLYFIVSFHCGEFCKTQSKEGAIKKHFEPSFCGHHSPKIKIKGIYVMFKQLHL